MVLATLVAAQEAKQFQISDFHKQFFWMKPPEGMFEVNVGLYSGGGLEDQRLMQFADINADMFTDTITVDKS